MLMAHFGCVFSHVWFLIKAWCYCNRHFVFNLIKQFLSLVWTLFGSELEITGRRQVASTEVLFQCQLLRSVCSPFMSAHDLPCTPWTLAEYCKPLDLQWNWPSCVHRLFPQHCTGVFFQFYWCILLFIFPPNSEKMVLVGQQPLLLEINTY
jgi:hypothetical protein